MNLTRLIAPLLLALTLLSVGLPAHACERQGVAAGTHEGQQPQPGMSYPADGMACPNDGMKHQGQNEGCKPCRNTPQTDTATPCDPHGCCIDPAQGGHLPTGAAPSDGAWLDLGNVIPMVVATLPLPRHPTLPPVFPTQRTPPPSTGVGSARLIC